MDFHGVATSRKESLLGWRLQQLGKHAPAQTRRLWAVVHRPPRPEGWSVAGSPQVSDPCEGRGRFRRFRSCSCLDKVCQEHEPQRLQRRHVGATGITAVRYEACEATTATGPEGLRGPYRRRRQGPTGPFVPRVQALASQHQALGLQCCSVPGGGRAFAVCFFGQTCDELLRAVKPLWDTRGTQGTGGHGARLWHHGFDGSGAFPDVTQPA
mmetsp:Transcript_21779/g.50487  ORF Transcript_21779/g.50487 Transcript_21779/m.50487 type:complete len:211 (+) Transcript_21779:278-910(+)